MFSTRYYQGGSGRPLVYLHAAGGLQAPLPLFDRLAEHFTVYAPVHPGWGTNPDDLMHVDDAIDMALYYQDFFDAVGIERPVVVGHSIGGMFGAELAAICSPCLSRLVLLCPAGLWRDDVPIPDFFTMQPPEMMKLVWHDVESPIAKAAMTPPESQEAMAEMMIARAQSLAAAGKFLWPIPDKGLKKRIHRIKTPTLILWGESDKLIPPAYAEEFHQKIAGSVLKMIPEASHMLPVEQMERVAQEIVNFAREE
jgi:pimeloyl-ACP methyl ester carboxylesterase